MDNDEDLLAREDSGAHKTREEQCDAGWQGV